MSYRKAEEILPRELIEVIQQYVDGENIYIPRKLAVSIERAKVSRDYPRNIILQKRVYSGLSVSIDNNKNEGCRKVAPIF